MTFIEKIKEALQGDVSQPDLAAAAKLIESRRQKRLRMGEGKNQILRRNGPCLMCAQEMEYSAKLAAAHMNYGNGWLDRFLSEWKRPVEIGQGHSDRDMTINGKSAQVYSPYVCADCKAMARRIFDEKFPYVEPTQEQHFYRFQLGGLPHAERWRSLMSVEWHAGIVESLCAIPYELFLTTEYWLLVREEMLRRAGLRCDSCGATQRLHVHHKTYDHHGQEHLHMNDLQVLCYVCHANVHEVEPRGNKADKQGNWNRDVV